MKQLLVNNNMNCDALKTYAFETHVGCYLNPGFDAKGFCEIAISNSLGLGYVYEFLDFMSMDALNQVC
jgi:hypothetical protein